MLPKKKSWKCLKAHVENWELLQAYQTAHPKQPSPPLLEVSWGTVNTWTPVRLSVSADAKVSLDRTSGSASATASGWEPGNTCSHCSQLRAVQVTGCHKHMSSLWRLNSSLRKENTPEIDFSTLWCAPLQIAHSKVQEQGAQAESSDMPVSPPYISKNLPGSTLIHMPRRRRRPRHGSAPLGKDVRCSSIAVEPSIWCWCLILGSKPFIRMLMPRIPIFFWTAWHQTTLSDVAFSHWTEWLLYVFITGKEEKKNSGRKGEYFHNVPTPWSEPQTTRCIHMFHKVSPDCVLMIMISWWW